MSLRITLADLDDSRLHAFLRAHFDDIGPTAPAESQHALDLDGLRAAGVRLWVAVDDIAPETDQQIVGTVALAPLSAEHDELKSMRTDPHRRGLGVGARLLEHALDDAARRGVTRLSLETGSMEFFAPARALYRKYGFQDCPPFADYTADPNSTFMTLELSETHVRHARTRV